MTQCLLAIDTSTENCSAALQVNGNVYSHSAESPREHSQRILPFVEQLLEEADCTFSDLEGIVVGVGPGSFTGVRIGVSVAQGLAYSRQLPVYPVASLQALAQQAIRRHQAQRVLACIDARMGEVYYAGYDNQQGVALAINEPAVAQPTAALLKSLGSTEDCVSAGTGWDTYGDVLTTELSASFRLTEDCRLPLAVDMLTSVNAGQVAAVAAADLEPLYVRNEVTWKKLPGR